ncbi:hypothetical protein ACSDQ9_13145 [Aestuariimicrobium soli]|uniref:hypothetical protein n=1 Tax=Aestuariimicrobium soli TaxID=2035834 RepID=UPI003EBD7F9D
MVMTMDDGGGGSFPELIDMYTLNKAWEDLKSRITTVWTNGEKWEAQTTAKTVADTAWCDEVEKFNDDINKLDKRITDAVTFIEQELSTKFEPNDGVAKKLGEMKDKWEKVGTKVQDTHDTVHNHLKLDDWGGEGGQEYKNVLPTQMKALVELKGLAQSQGETCDQTSLMNAYIWQNTKLSIDTVRNRLPKSYSRASITDKGYSTKVNGTMYDQWAFARNGIPLADNLESLQAWLTKQTDPYDSDWAGSANSLKSDLTKVTSAPLNLQPSGEWPGIKMRVEGDPANTAGLGWNNTNVSGNYDYNYDDGNMELNA